MQLRESMWRSLAAIYVCPEYNPPLRRQHPICVCNRRKKEMK